MNPRLLFLLLCATPLLPGQAVAGVPANSLRPDEVIPAESLRVSNNHPFAVRETLRFHLPAELADGAGNLLAVSHSVSGGTVEAHYLPVQLDRPGDGEAVEAWLDVQLRANESRTYTFQDVGGGGQSQVAVAGNFPSGLPSRLQWPSDVTAQLFDVALLEILEDLEDLANNRSGHLREQLKNVLRPKFELQEETHGPVKSTLLYQGSAEGKNRYEIDVRYHLFSSGITDVEITLRTTELRAERGYLAVAKEFASPAEEEAFIRWKGETRPIDRGAASPDRTNRMHSWGRDVNWLAVSGKEEGENRAILARFSTNLTRLHNDRHHLANDYLVNEFVIGGDETWTMLAEIARENAMANYVPSSFVLPRADEPIRLAYRVLPPKARTVEDVDQAFISYAGYQSRHAESDAFHISFGVPGVSFGTSYFPHSTFGEHFQYWRSAGLKGDRWWPLFGENWRWFKEDIRRDMRIANAMGLDWIRIHHFDSPNFREDYLTTEAGKWMVDYLGFMAETARDTGLGLFLDFSLSPSDARLVAEKFGDVIGFYEIQNEVLLMGAFADRIDYWREVRDEIRSVRPDAPVFLTGGPQFYSIYDRLDRLDLAVDAVGQHAYVDARQSPAYVKDIALSLGGYATRQGKLPLNSEYNWRMITRETEDDQARHFFEIYDDFLSQRSVPLLLQFQFVETMAVAPRTRGALRHYEPLRVDRTPKRQAHAYHEIIRRYGRADNRIKTLEISMPLLSIRPGRKATVPVTLKNLTARPLEVQLNSRLPEGLTTDDGEETITLRARQSRTVQRSVRAADDLAPGFYHFFQEARFDDIVRLGWSYAAHRAAPRLDLETEPMEGVRYAGGLQQFEEINLATLRHLVFGREAPALEVDWALYLYNTLRSATGAEIQRWAHDQIDDDRMERSLVLVGNQESNPLIGEVADRLPINPLELEAGEGAVMVVEHPDYPDRFLLLISGRDAQGVEKAASDFLFRYWRYAKDAASFRDGMATVESDFLRPVAAAASAADIVLEGPARVERGAPVRLRALHATEPPSPAAGVAVQASRGGEAMELGTTDDGGELRTTFSEPGAYRIRAASSPAELIIEVK